MAKWKLPEGRKPLTTMESADLVLRMHNKLATGFTAGDRIEELEAKLAMADKLASEFKNCLEVLTKEDDYVCCSGHQCGCYGASLHAQAIYYANEAIDDYHKTTGGKDE